MSSAAILRAIELNGVAIESNTKSFMWGRRAAHNAAEVEKLAKPAEIIPITQRISRTLDEIVARRVDDLTAYQDANYAQRYRSLVERVKQRETEVSGSSKLTEAVARYYYKLLAYKDEYEVARLYTAPEFMQRVNASFEGDFKLKFHLAPPLVAKSTAPNGEPKKIEFGSWMMPAFRVLAKLKGLRGTALDVFGYTAERKMERQLIADYERDIGMLIDGLTVGITAGKLDTAVGIASLPEHVRGYGHIKAENVAKVAKQREQLLAAWKTTVHPIAMVA